MLFRKHRRRLDREVDLSIQVQSIDMMHSVSANLKAGEKEQARETVQQILALRPRDSLVYIFAVAVYKQLGDEADSVLHSALAVIMDPNLASYKHLAKHLHLRGHEALAHEVLRRGWEDCKKTPMMEQEEYFHLP